MVKDGFRGKTDLSCAMENRHNQTGAAGEATLMISKGERKCMCLQDSEQSCVFRAEEKLGRLVGPIKELLEC